MSSAQEAARDAAAAGESPGRPLLRFVIGRHFREQGGVRVFHGEHDVSELFDLKRIQFLCDADSEHLNTRVQVVLLAEVDVEAEAELYRVVKPRDLIGFMRSVADSCGHRPRGALATECLGCRAWTMLTANPAVVCAACGLPPEVHGHGENGPTSHLMEWPEGSDPREPVVDALKAAGAREVRAGDRGPEGDLYGRTDSDPHPLCSHEWCGMGLTTAVDPPIGWSVCFKCHTVRARVWDHELNPRTDPPSELWYQREWSQGPFDWQKEAARHGERAPLGPGQIAIEGGVREVTS